MTLMPLDVGWMKKWLKPGAIVLFAGGLAAGVHASSSRAVPPQGTWQAECVGYYSMELPSGVDYGAIEPKHMWPFVSNWGFPLNLAPAFDMVVAPDPGATVSSEREKRRLYVSRPAKPEALAEITLMLNARLEHNKQVMLDEAAGFDKFPAADESGWVREKLRTDAAAIRFYKPVPGLQAIADDDGKLTHFYVLLGDQRIVQALRPSLASPALTIEAFLQQYSPREPFATPTGPGACLPHGFYRGESLPAFIGATFTLTDHPDILINVTLSDAQDGSKEPRQALLNLLRGHLADADEILPLDGRIKSSHTVTIDGQEGLGHFALVRRKVSPPGAKDPLDNIYTKDHRDWAYIAYAPGISGGKPGESFNIQVRVERFGRFAKEPVGQQMTEKQFREFAKRFVVSIHRRPGAWVVK
jgi:hypothetical protein